MPDIQTMTKGLEGGYVSIYAVLASQYVVKVIMNGSGEFTHGHIYKAMLILTVGVLEVLIIIQEDKLLDLRI